MIKINYFLKGISFIYKYIDFYIDINIDKMAWFELQSY
jgi:hypothetical protein